MRTSIFYGVLFLLGYIITIAAVLAIYNKYDDSINSLCNVALGGLIGYMSQRVLPRRGATKDGEDRS